MILIKSDREIALMRKAGQLLTHVFELIEARLGEGVSGLELDAEAERFIESQGAEPAFKGYRGYPATICFSVNEGVVHGIPGQRRLRVGDIVAIDIGLRLNGYYADSARSYAIGPVSALADKLLRVTSESLWKGIDQCRPGARLGDLSSAIQRHVEREGFSVVRELVGHGIGRSMHEDPAVPNFGSPGTGPVLREGMVFAIEPMVNAGGPDIEVLDDDWTVVTADGSLSAHFEHTVAVTSEGPEVLTLIR